MSGIKFSPQEIEKRALQQPSRLVPGVKSKRSPTKKSRNEDLEAMSLSELKKAKTNADEAADIERAEMIATAIASSSAKELEEKIEQMKNRLSETMAIAIENYNQRKLELCDRIEDHQLELRTKINEHFEVLQNRQLNALVELEVDREMELARETKRSISDGVHKHTSNAARVLTKAANFAEAKMVQAAMEKDKEELTRRAIQRVNDKYDQAARHLNAKHITELQNLQEELTNQLKALDQEYTDELEVLKKTINVFAQHVLQKEIVSISNMNPKRSEISSQLTTHVKKILEDIIL